MEETKVTFETAKLAKEKGFNILCESFYDNEGTIYKSDVYLNEERNNAYSSKSIELCKAPTQSLLQKWFREVHNIDVNPLTDTFVNKDESFKYVVYVTKSKEIDVEYKDFNSYEEALEFGLQEAFKLL